MDQPPHDKVTGATVAGAADSPSADLLAGWLALALKVPVKRVKSPAKSGPGLHSVVLNRRCGDISLIRPQTITAELKVANQPERHVALPRRGLRDCLSEELRRLDADDVYAEVLTKGMALVAKQAAAADPKAPAARATPTASGNAGPATARAKAAPADQATAVKAHATKAAGHKARPTKAGHAGTASTGRRRCGRRQWTIRRHHRRACRGGRSRSAPAVTGRRAPTREPRDRQPRRTAARRSRRAGGAPRQSRVVDSRSRAAS